MARVSKFLKVQSALFKSSWAVLATQQIQWGGISTNGTQFFHISRRTATTKFRSFTFLSSNHRNPLPTGGTPDPSSLPSGCGLWKCFFHKTEDAAGLEAEDRFSHASRVHLVFLLVGSRDALQLRGI